MSLSFLLNNILFLAPNIDLEKPDAQSVHVLEITKALSHLGVDVHAVVKKNSNTIHKSPGVKLKSIDHGTGLIAKLLDGFHIAWFVFYSAVFERVDVIYIRQYLAACIPALIAKIFKCPVFVEINGIYLDDQRMSGAYPSYIYKYKYLLSFYEWILSKFLELLYRCSSGIIVVAPGLVDYLNKKHAVPKEKIHVCRNGVNIETIEPLDKQRCRIHLGLQLDRRYIGYVGSLLPWQGVDFFIKVFASICDKKKNVDLVIVGSGDEESYLKGIVNKLKIDGRIFFTGGVHHDLALQYLGSFDFIIAPYTTSFPRSIIMSVSAIKIPESLAAGRPVIVSKLPGLEYIEDEHLGFLAIPDDLEDWKKQTINALNLDEKAYQNMSACTRTYAVKELTWMNTANCICDFIRDIIHSS